MCRKERKSNTKYDNNKLIRETVRKRQTSLRHESEGKGWITRTKE